jgi:hypothetical protein
MTFNDSTKHQCTGVLVAGSVCKQKTCTQKSEPSSGTYMEQKTNLGGEDHKGQMGGELEWNQGHLKQNTCDAI